MARARIPGDDRLVLDEIEFVDADLDLTPEVGGLASVGTLLEVGLAINRMRTLLLEARLAEANDEQRRAVDRYERIVKRTSGSKPPELMLFRAMALAAVARLRHDEVAARRAAKLFGRLPEHLLGGIELGDWASSLEGDDPARAMELHTAAVRTGGAPPFSYHQVAILTAEGGDNATALALFEQAATLGPMDPRLQLDYAEALAAADRRAGAEAMRAAASVFAYRSSLDSLAVAKRALDLDPDDPVGKVVYADMLRIFDKSREAVRVLESVPTDDLSSRVAIVAARVRSRALLDLGRLAAALRALAPLLASPRANPEDFRLAAELHEARGDRRQKRAALDKAIELRPDDASLTDALMRDFLATGEYEAAEARLVASIRAGLRGPWAQIALGVLRARTGSAPDLAPVVEEAAAGDMSADDAWQLVDDLAMRVGRPDIAEAAAQALVGLRPSDPVRLQALGVRQQQLGRSTEAADSFRRALRHDPSNPQLLGQLGEVLRLQGDLRGALVRLDRAVAQPGVGPWVVATRGQVLLALGRPEEAIDDLEAGLSQEANAALNGAGQPLAIAWAVPDLYLAYRLAGRERAGHKLLMQFLDLLGDADRLMVGARLFDAGATDVGQESVDASLRRIGTARGPARRSIAALLHGERGRQLAALNRLDEAIDAFRSSLRLDPRNAVIHRMLGLALLDAGLPGAARELGRASSLDPDDPENLRAIAYLRATRDDYKGAAAILEDAVGRLGPSATLLSLRAAIALDLPGADLTTALEDARAVRREAPDWPRLDALEGTILSRLSRDAEAEPLLTNGVADDPTDEATRLELALVLLARERPGLALRHLHVLTEPADDESRGRWLALQALAHLLLEHRARAEPLYAQALAINPDQGWAWADLGRLLYLRRDVQVARTHVERALALGSRDADTLILYGAILADVGDRTLATSALEEAISDDPTRSDARSRLADLWLLQDKPVAALAALGPEAGETLEVGLKRIDVLFALGDTSQAVARAGQLMGDSPASDTVATIMASLQNWDRDKEAIGFLEGYPDPEPTPADLSRLVASLLSTIGEFELAVAMLRRTAQANPRDGDVQAELGWACSNLGPDWLDEGERAWAKARRLLGDNAWNLKGHAELVRVRGDRAGAARLYERAMQFMAASTSDTEHDRIWFKGWCEYATANYDTAIPYLVRSTRIPTARAGGDRFDLGVALLAAGRGDEAISEYERAIRELARVGDPLRQRGLLRVAIHDLTEWGDTTDERSGNYDRILEGLSEALHERDAARVAIEPFLDRMTAWATSP